MSTQEDLDQTVKQVKDLGRRIVAQADVRDVEALQQAFNDGAAELGPVTIVVANAGIGPGGIASSDQQWDEVIGVNLKGVWNTGRVAIPSMIKRDRGGSIVLTSSTGGLIGSPSSARNARLHRGQARRHRPHALVGQLPRAALHPRQQGRADDGAHADGQRRRHVDHPGTRTRAGQRADERDAGEAVEAIDVANAIAWLASDEARYITGTVLPVDAGNVNRR